MIFLIGVVAILADVCSDRRIREGVRAERAPRRRRSASRL